MSVIVMGMEMPENCHECRLCAQEADTEFGVCAYCGATAKQWEAYSYRPDWCPLRPLPEKHGRLIDAEIPEDDRQVYGFFYDTDLQELLDKQPTIVEVEGE